jgi:amino acid transporter
MTKSTGLNVFVLAMLITGAIDSVRNLPATALFGSSLIFFFIFSALVFLIPAAFVSAELTATWHERGGIYQWVKLAFGENAGFLAIWLQWIANVVWFPTILSFIGGTAAYLIDPALGQNKFFLVSVILVSFWFVTFLNLKGIKISAQFASFCAVFGMIIPIALIVGLALLWLISGKPLQIHFTANNIFPTFNNPDNWISLTAIMTAFLGMELATVHIRDVNNPQKTFPKALYVSVLIILFTMIFGALAIAVVLPKDQINLVNGVMQAFTNFFAVYHMKWIIPIIAIMLLVGSIGGIVSWVVSPVRGLVQAGKMGFFPEFLTRENKKGVAGNLLILQAVLVSLFCMAFLYMPSVNGSYWLLTALSTQLYMLMYVMMFVTAIYLRHKYPNQPRAYSMPGGKKGVWVICITGLIGCAITEVVGFIPPNGINVGTIFHYEMIFISGMFAMTLPILLCYYYKNRQSTILPLVPETETSV